MIRIVPAIDLIGGRCVRLTRGDYATKKVYDASPVETARRYADCGVQRIHLVDLDGAKASRPCNLSVLEQIAAAVSCELEWGGGIASSEDLARVFDAGATHAIVGSVAALQPERFEEWLSRWGSRMVLGADVRQTEGRPVPPEDLSSLSEDLPVPPSSQGSRGYAPQGQSSAASCASVADTPLVIEAGQSVMVSVEVTNTGDLAGDEVVQLYIKDDCSSVITYERQLAGFERIHLLPGETRTVTFTVGPDRMQLLDASCHWVVEPGTFTLFAGPSSEDLPLSASFLVR
jgi:hypothetical protein